MEVLEVIRKMEKVLNNYFYRLPQSSAYAGAYNLLNKINKNRKRSLKTYNNNYTYLLVVIDVLSKFAWVQPLHDKSSKSVARAFEHILTLCKGQHPVYLQTDKGKEFIGKEM